MKKHIINIILVMLVPVICFAQAQNVSPDDSRKTGKEEKKTPQTEQVAPDNGKTAEEAKTDDNKSGFIDKDGDGIDDRAVENEGDDAKQGGQKNQGKQKRMRDRFIDKDGDGINDNRCKGMGFGCGKGKCKSQPGKK